MTSRQIEFLIENVYSNILLIRIPVEMHMISNVMYIEMLFDVCTLKCYLMYVYWNVIWCMYIEMLFDVFTLKCYLMYDWNVIWCMYIEMLFNVCALKCYLMYVHWNVIGCMYIEMLFDVCTLKSFIQMSNGMLLLICFKDATILLWV